MTGLSSDLYRRCREALLRCAEFDTNAALRAVFVTAELVPFRNGLPEATAKAARVDVTLDYLLPKQLSDGHAVLPLFLVALAGRYDPADALHATLCGLAAEIGEGQGQGSASPSTTASPSPSVFDQRGQQVQHQVNVAGNVTIIHGDGNVVGDSNVVSVNKPDGTPPHKP
ncbi:MAG: hypothetical protein JW963_03965 [Anaerolineales bacterium]|nr:hypothetical protein [Anaerolineales bacterium]